MSGAMDSLFPVYLFVALSFPITVWILVGMWRSALNRGGFWGGLVMFLVLVAVIANVAYWAFLVTVSPDEAF
jgi:hypothetical protein